MILRLHHAERITTAQVSTGADALLLRLAPVLVGDTGPVGPMGGVDRDRETIAFVTGQQSYTLNTTLTALQVTRAQLEISSAPNVIAGQGYSITGNLLTLDINLMACMRAGDIMQLTY